MRLSNFLTSTAIIGLVILAGTESVPVLASTGSDPAASLTTPEDVVVQGNSQQSPNSEVIDIGSTPNNDPRSEDVGQLSPNTEVTDLGSTHQ